MTATLQAASAIEQPEAGSPAVGDLRPAPTQARPMAGGAIMSAASRIFVTIAGAATTIVVAHILGPAGFGAYAVAVTLLAILLVATTLGIDHGIVYYVSSGRWAPADAFGSSQRLAWSAGLLGALGVMLARLLMPGVFSGLSVAVTLMAAAALPFLLSWFYGGYVALASGHYEGYVLPPAIQALSALCLVAAFAAADGVMGAVAGLLAAHVLTAAIRFRASRRRFGGGGVRRPEQQGLLRQAIRFGTKGYAANALQAVNMRIDLFVLNSVAAGAAVGHYALAVSVTSLLMLLPRALSDMLFPRVASLNTGQAEHEEMLREAEAKTLRHCSLATLAVTAACAVGLLALVVPVYGASFRSSIGLGLVLLPGVAAYGVSGVLAAALVGRGRPGVMLQLALIVTPPTLVLYWVLIPTLHATGAALASTISYLMSFVLVCVFYGRVSGRSPLPLLVPTRDELADYRTLLRRWRSSRASANLA